MSNVVASPEIIAAAATDVAAVGAKLSAAHMAAAVPTVAVIPAAADEVSASIAHLFSGHAQDYQALAGQAAAFHEQFVQHLTASARSYAATEAANASLLQPLTASVGSIGSAIAASPGLLLNMLTSLWGQLTALLNALPEIGIFALIVAALTPLIVPLALFLGSIILLAAIGLALLGKLQLFGVWF